MNKKKQQMRGRGKNENKRKRTPYIEVNTFDIVKIFRAFFVQLNCLCERLKRIQSLKGSMKVFPEPFFMSFIYSFFSFISFIYSFIYLLHFYGWWSRHFFFPWAVFWKYVWRFLCRLNFYSFLNVIPFTCFCVCHLTYFYLSIFSSVCLFDWLVLNNWA